MIFITRQDTSDNSQDISKMYLSKGIYEYRIDSIQDGERIGKYIYIESFIYNQQSYQSESFLSTTYKIEIVNNPNTHTFAFTDPSLLRTPS